MSAYRKKPVVIDAVRWDGRLSTAMEFMGCWFSVDNTSTAGSANLPAAEGATAIARTEGTR